MKAKNHLSDLLSELVDVPLRIAHLVGEMNEATLQAVVAECEWSVLEVFAHIRASDDILVSRVYALLTRDRPPPSGEGLSVRPIEFPQVAYRVRAAPG